jgi:hypothetical protein
MAFTARASADISPDRRPFGCSAGDSQPQPIVDCERSVQFWPSGLRGFWRVRASQRAGGAQPWLGIRPRRRAQPRAQRRFLPRSGVAFTGKPVARRSAEEGPRTCLGMRPGLGLSKSGAGRGTQGRIRSRCFGALRGRFAPSLRPPGAAAPRRRAQASGDTPMASYTVASPEGPLLHVTLALLRPARGRPCWACPSCQ